MTEAIDIPARNRDAAAERNRQHMPLVGEIVDAVRAVFGPNVRVLYAKEGEIIRGRVQPEGVQPSMAPETHEKLKRRFARTQRAMGIAAE